MITKGRSLWLLTTRSLILSSLVVPQPSSCLSQTSVSLLVTPSAPVTKRPRSGTVSPLFYLLPKVRSLFPLSRGLDCSKYFPKTALRSKRVLKKSMFIWKTRKYRSQIKAELFKNTYPRLPSGRDGSKQLKSLKENHKIPCVDFRSPASLSTDKVLVRPSVLTCLWVPSATILGLLKLDRYLSIILFRVLWCGQIWPYALPYQPWKHLLYRK